MSDHLLVVDDDPRPAIAAIELGDRLAQREVAAKIGVRAEARVGRCQLRDQLRELRDRRDAQVGLEPVEQERRAR